jgi:hypothetical protein
VAIFTTIAGWIAGSTLLAGTFLGTAAAIPWIAAGLGIAASIGLNYVAQALSGTEAAPADRSSFGVDGRLSAGGAIPRSFGIGTHVSAGSLVYANYWGFVGETPNAYLTQVIAVSDMPREQLLEVWVQNEKCTLSARTGEFGTAVDQYHKDGVDHLWVKYYNGTQTTADPFLTGRVSSADRPYGGSRIGTGICYVIVTSLVAEKLFSGFPTFKFVMSGIPLYDPSKDSTNGGSGSHRYSDPATWGGDGDQLPAVQAYNILRGIRYNGAWLYGLQHMTGAARLPAANWNLQIAKCRDLIVGETGPEPTYRAGGQIHVDARPADAIEALLTACQGRLSEIGGFYKIHLGSPDSPTFAWTDADLLSSEQQIYRPFFGLADSINGIQGTYPDPAQGWEIATAPALYRTDLEVRDGNRRLMANPQFAFVPYRAQVQRLQKSGIEEAQRARTHVLPFPPSYWVVEPGDIGSWNSFRNGYIDKLFRVDSAVDRSNLDVVLNVTEIDPSDYDWEHGVDYTGVSTGPTVFPRPSAQGVIDWYAEGTVLYDADGLGRRVAIRISWDGSLPGVVGIQYEVRLTADLSHVTRGRTDQLAAGALLISQGLIPLTAYQVRGQYLPSAPREMLWSDWLSVVTPEEPIADIPAWIAIQATIVIDYLNDRLAEVEQRLSTVTASIGQRSWLDLKEGRTQFSAQHGTALAEISRVETVAVDNDAAMATAITNVDAKFGSGFSNVNTVQQAFADNAVTFGNYQTSVSAQFNTTNANVTTNATAIASIEGWGAAQYSVTLDVNGYATGFELINGGPGVSATIFTTEKFQVASPGVGGGAPVPIFTIANVDGTPKTAIRGDMYATGTIAGTKIVSASITATQIEAETIDTTRLKANNIQADRLLAGTITSDSGKIGALSVKSLSIGDYAVVVPVAETRADPVGDTAGPFVNVSNVTLSFDTTGLAGKSLTVIAGFTGQVAYSGTGGSPGVRLLIDGAEVQRVQSSNSSDQFLSLTGSRVFSAIGGAESHGVIVQWATPNNTGVPILAGRTLWAMVGKR